MQHWIEQKIRNKNRLTMTWACCTTLVETIVVFAEFGFIPPCWIRLCWLSSALVRKPSPHAVHGYGWSPVCKRIWATSVRFWRNSLPHTVQECGTRPWIRPWLTNWNLRGKVAPQSGHSKGLSEPWNRECITKWSFCAKLSPQSSQTNGRSPAWNLLCVTKCLLSGNERPHSWQINGRSRLWTYNIIYQSINYFKIIKFLINLHENVSTNDVSM